MENSSNETKAKNLIFLIKTLWHALALFRMDLFVAAHGLGVREDTPP